MTKYFVLLLLTFSGLLNLAYEQAPSFEWAKQVGGTGIEAGLALETNSLGNLFIAGSFFSSSVDFDSTILINVNSSPEIFIAKLELFPLGINEIQVEKNFTIYPSPTNDKVFFDFGTNTNPIVHLSILDCTGKEIKTIDTAANEISMQDLPDGFYFIRLESQNFTVTRRILKK